MPTKASVAEKVLKLISVFANYPESKIAPSFVLANPPLKMDSTQLSFMALSLRAYVRSNNPEQTVQPKEVKKSNLSVTDLIELIYKKVNIQS